VSRFNTSVSPHRRHHSRRGSPSHRLHRSIRRPGISSGLPTRMPHPRALWPPPWPALSRTSMAALPRCPHAMPSSSSPPTTARRTPSTGSTSASSFSVGSGPSRRTALGSPPIISRAPPRHGITPSSRTRAACPHGIAFASYAFFASGHQSAAAAWRNLGICRSPPRCRTLPTASRPSLAMLVG
jgi:hypothetical protein